MIKDTDFYNKESTQYSAKRYPMVARTYAQDFFKKRLALLMALLKKQYATKSEMRLLEVGCADGVVLREVDARLGNVFSLLVGMDLAPDMIKSAIAMNASPRAVYFVRGQEPRDTTYDVVIEVGVANYANFDQELEYADRVLKSGGRYFLSIAGKGSLNDRFGRGVGYNNFLSYQEYESKIRSKFRIEEVAVVGLFMPLAWAIPPLARHVQTCFEAMLAPIWPNLFHEKIYVLKRLSDR